MTCTPIRIAGFATAIVCDRGRRAPKCKSCGAHGAPKLCDFDVGGGKTCDAKCCSSCATHVGDDRDYCPRHKETTVTERTKPPPRGDVAMALLAKVLDALGVKAMAETVAEASKEIDDELHADRARSVAWYRSNVKLLLDTIGADAGECRSCGAPIRWVVTKNGKKAPITQDGLNHFGNCPHAALHRKAVDAGE